MHRRPIAILVAAGTAGVLALVALAGCSSGSTSSDTPPPTTMTTTAPSPASTATAFNTADAAFARNTWTLNQQTAALAGLVAGHTSRSELRAMAGQMDGYTHESDSLHAMMDTWHQPAPSPTGSGTEWPWGSPGTMGPGMMSPGHWDGWGEMHHMNGTEFDSHWIDAATSADSAMIAQCRAELTNGTNAQAKALAQQMLAERRHDLDQLHAWHDTWGHDE